MKKQKTNKVKTVVYLIHFILIDIWARNGVLHIFSPRGNSRDFFPRIFGVCSRFLGDETFMDQILHNFWGDFHFIIVIRCSLC